MKLDSFTRKYQLAKTLRFELRPIGRTLETFNEKFRSGDERRGGAYPGVKALLDERHRALLERALSNPPPLDWGHLAHAYEEYRSSNKSKAEKDALFVAQASYRKALSAHFRNDEAFALLTAKTPSKLFKSLRDEYVRKNVPIPDDLSTFLHFSCYFSGYQKNRLNIYSDAAQTTSAANRAVNENFPKFLENIRIFHHIADFYPEILADTERELSDILQGKPLASLFEPTSYGGFLSQSRIDFFNSVLGGIAPNEGKQTRGINGFINLYRTQHKEAREDHSLSFLRPLYKQMLSDHETRSFVPLMFQDDNEVVTAIRRMLEKRFLSLETEAGTVNVADELQTLLATLSPSSTIWINRSAIPRISKDFLGSWEKLFTLIESGAEIRFVGENTEKKRSDTIEKPAFSLAELSALREETDVGTTIIDVSQFWRDPAVVKRIDAARKAVDEVLPVLEPDVSGTETPLRERKDVVARIKVALDAILDILHLVKSFRVDESFDRDEAFYGTLGVLYDALNSFVLLYNKVRDYITKKPGEIERIKLMFENPHFAEGWDQNKEMDYTCVLFFRDGLYYLGVMDPKAKTDFSKLSGPETSGCYRKMVYKAISKAAQYFSIKQIGPQNPPQFVLEWLAKGFDKKTLSHEQLSRLISYVIEEFIPKYPPLKDKNGRVCFDFDFKEPSAYASWKEFTDYIASVAYSITYEYISAEAVNRLVEEGRLCLFQLWNKDFSKASTGRPNLHTQYWNAVFAPENLRDVVFKLNGEAELFFRPKGITEPFRHKVGEKMVNRRGADADGSPMPESVHGELFRHFNGSLDPLSDEARAWINSGNLVVKDVEHEIVKDRRFTEDKFFFHVPLTINYKQPKDPASFNAQVRKYLRCNPDVNVIGIDRGERNLIYLTLVDRHGNLLEQRSFNIVSRIRRDGAEVRTDYRAKLAQAEKDRAHSRLSWSEIGAIKDLKAGYLSAVVHEIATMMVEHNAIVVLEDLNPDFKRSRVCFERQVYQKFEKALIDKLNYLVFKDRGMADPGGTLRGYQLTDAFESFEKIGRQTGFLFYVPAGYTSKIDPTTGFTNLFNTKRCTNAAGVRDFFSAFDSIRWDASRRAFAFAFDYANFKTSQTSHRTKWTVYSASRRLVFDNDARKEINPTAILLDSLEARGIAVADGFDLKSLLVSTEPSKANASFFRSVFYAFDRTLQMRNSRGDEDYIESPVLNGRGEFFDSRKAGPELPRDADANGAYHIALKGVLLLEENLAAEKPDLKIAHKDWFRFAQNLAAKKFK